MVSILSACAVQKTVEPTNSNNASKVFILRPVCGGNGVAGKSEEVNQGRSIQRRCCQNNTLKIYLQVVGEILCFWCKECFL